MTPLLLVLAVAQPLAEEVRDKGRLVFAARTEAGDWDLFVMRPDGTERRNLTNTPGFHEAFPRVAADGRRLLYRRLPREEEFQGPRRGGQGELLVGSLEGGEPAILGRAGEYPWATWMPDGRRIVCLEHRGVTVVDPETRRTLGRLERKGFYQQVVASPDGRSVVGVTDAFQTPYAVARMDLASGALQLLSRVNCSTAEWFADGRRLLFSRRPDRWVELWVTDAEGKAASKAYAEEGMHCYAGAPSPDGRYAVFTRNPAPEDPGSVGGTLAVIRLGGTERLDLGEGWTPQWVPK